MNICQWKPSNKKCIEFWQLHLSEVPEIRMKFNMYWSNRICWSSFQYNYMKMLIFGLFLNCKVFFTQVMLTFVVTRGFFFESTVYSIIGWGIWRQLKQTKLSKGYMTCTRTATFLNFCETTSVRLVQSWTNNGFSSLNIVVDPSRQVANQLT